jgi:uncharacterized protein
MTPLEFGVIFSAGLATGLHCVQMCGPIVLTYGVSVPKGSAWRAHLSYNAGRITTYMLLGALAGAAGGALGLAGRLAGLASGARIVAGVAMIVAGIVMIGFGPSSAGLVSIGKTGITARLTRPIARLLTAPGGKFRLGLLLGFLPCGMLYAALLKAVDAAGALAGAITMLAFGLGTGMALVAVGMGSSFAGARLRGAWSNRIAAVSIAAAGAFLLWRGIMGGGHHHG